MSGKSLHLACWPRGSRPATASGCPRNRASSALTNGGSRCGRSLTRSEEHTSELQSLMRISYAVFCLTKKHHLTEKGDEVQIRSDEHQSDLTSMSIIKYADYD